MITPLQISIVQQSWKQVFPIHDQAAELFYQRLFELDPSVRALFTGDMTQQGRKLMDMIHVASLRYREMNGTVAPSSSNTTAAATCCTVAESSWAMRLSIVAGMRIRY